MEARSRLQCAREFFRFHNNTNSVDSLRCKPRIADEMEAAADIRGTGRCSGMQFDRAVCRNLTQDARREKGPVDLRQSWGDLLISRPQLGL